jgi:membrane protein DedA with SNARE-associated domain
VAGFIEWMNGLPDILVYVVLWLGAAVENVVPAVPADTFVALGGFLSGAGDLNAAWVAGGTWLFNVAGAVTVYRLSFVHGAPFFDRGLGRHLLLPHQMKRMARFYDRWGTPALFLSRFVPGVRAVAPVFAGATHQSWSRVVPPIAIASALWYGGLVVAGRILGSNLDRLAEFLSDVNRSLGVAAIVLGVLVAIWWVRTRKPPPDEAPDPSAPEEETP